MDIHGLDVTIEKRKGDTRSGIGKNGTRWVSDPLPCAYGCIKGYRAKDGESVDAYVGPDKTSTKVWVVDQVKDNGAYDEAKVLLGFASKADALSHYRRAFSDGRGASRIGGVAELDISRLKAALADGKLKKPMAKKTGGSLDMARAYAMGGRVRYDDGGAVPLSDMGPLPGQDWPQSYEPEGGMEFLRLLRDASIGTAKAVAPPMPRWPSSREEALEMIGEPKSLGQFATEEVVPSAIAAFAPGLGQIPAVRSAGRYVLERPLASLLTAGGLGSAAAVAATDASGEERWNPETAKGPYSGPKRNSIETKGIQERAAAQGLYPKDKIDGIDSGGTRAAEWELIKAERKEAAAQKLLETQANTAAEEASTKKSKQKADEDQAGRDAEERKTGLSQFDAATKDPANSPWITPNIGYGLGAGVGSALGLGVSAIFDKRARTLMQGANELLKNVGAKGKAAGTLSKRIGDVNDFARKGGAGEATPFKRAATQDPPWKANAKATDPSKLYPPRSMVPEYLTQGALVAGGLTEMGVSMVMSRSAHARLKEAEEAVRKTPNPTTTAAYLDARNSANLWDSLDNMGRSWALTQGTAAKLGPMAFGGDRRPNIGKYEGEVGDLSKKLRTEKKKVKDYEAQTSAEKAAKEQQKSARAEARAAKKKGAGPGPAATALVGGSQLPGALSRPEAPSSPISEELALPNSMETEGFRKRGGSVSKHHWSHYQPRNPIGKFAGGPVYPHKESGGSVREKQAPALASLLEVARDYAARPHAEQSGSVGKRDIPYLLQDYGMDKATNDLLFSRRPKRDNGGPVDYQNGGNVRVMMLPARAIKKELPGVMWVPATPLPYPDLAPKVMGTGPVANDKRTGGAVGYDHGGVVTGGIVGDHGGRADTRPVSVPSGSYVLPADVVSAIGQSNSLAGIKMCDRMFGKPSSGKAAGGPAQAVAIRISDGEYALSPEQVARVGGGSLEDGHRVLDKFTLAVRKKHAQNLSRLPPPAKD